MTRKHFEVLAAVLGKTLEAQLPRDGVSAAEVACEFAEQLAHTNPRFDAQRFVTATLQAFADANNAKRDARKVA